MAKNNTIYIDPDREPWTQYKADVLTILGSIETSSHVIWCDAFEGLRFPDDDNVAQVHQLVKLLGERDIMLTIITSLDMQTVDSKWSELQQFVSVVCWPTYFLHNAFLEYTARQYVPDSLDFPYTDDRGYTYPFIVYNGKPRPHRCMLMDSFAEQGLFKNNAYTWNRPNNDYEFEVFDQKPDYTGLEYPPVDQHQAWYDQLRTHCAVNPFKRHPLNIDPQRWWLYSVHPQYAQAFCQVVSETTVDYVWMTDKTFEPIMALKPFLIHGGQHIHAKLVEMGFRLYDCFDYSFDSDPDPAVRAEGIMENMKALQGKNLNEIYHNNSHIIWENAQHFLNIIQKQQRVPREIYDYTIDQYVTLIAHSSAQVEAHEYFSAVQKQDI